MSDTDNEPDDELELAPEPVEDLDSDDDDVKGGGLPRETADYSCH